MSADPSGTLKKHHETYDEVTLLKKPVILKMQDSSVTWLHESTCYHLLIFENLIWRIQHHFAITKSTLLQKLQINQNAEEWHITEKYFSYTV